MTKRTFKEAEILELLDGAEEVSSGHWRHGRRVTYVVPADGCHWLVTVEVHHEDGIQLYGDIDGVLAKKVERTVTAWEADL